MQPIHTSTQCKIYQLRTTAVSVKVILTLCEPRPKDVTGIEYLQKSFTDSPTMLSFFNKKGIYKWKQKRSDLIFTSCLKPCRVLFLRFSLTCCGLVGLSKWLICLWISLSSAAIPSVPPQSAVTYSTLRVPSLVKEINTIPQNLTLHSNK